MLSPFGHGPHHAAGSPGGDDGFLKFQGIPLGHRAPHGIAVFRHAQHTQGGVPVVGEIAVQVAPAPVFGRIHPHYRRAFPSHRRAVEFQVLAAAKGRRGPPRVDGNVLTTPSAEFPKVRHGEAHGRQAGRRGFPDSEGRGQYRVNSARKLDLTGPRVVPTGNRKQFLQNGFVRRHIRSLPVVASERFGFAVVR